MRYIHNLALAGGGIKVLSFCGALYRLDKIHKISNIKRIIATSAGCIIALMVICGFSVEEMIELVKERDMSEIKSNDTLINNLYRFAFNFGFNDGTSIESWIIELLSIKKINPTITFKELHNLFDKELILTVCYLNKRELKLLSSVDTPDLEVVKGVRMAMTFPLYFEPINNEDGNIYVDGALICNYPIDYLRSYDPYLENTIGLTLTCDNQERGKYHAIGTIFDMFDLIMATLNLALKDNLSIEAKKKTITINTKEIDMFDFNLTDKEKERLFARGYRAVKEYFKKLN